MKQNFFFITFLFLSCIQLGAQTTDVVTGLANLEGMALNGNDLYVIQYTDKISKIDITSPTPTTATDVITGLDLPISLAFHGNDLYIAEYYGDKVSKIDITSPTPTATDVITGGIGNPTEVLIVGNDLYMMEYEPGRISKIDITAPTPTTATDVITGVDYCHGMALNGNDLYFTHIKYGVGKISKIDITETTPTITDVVNGLGSPRNLRFHGNDLYFTQDNATLSKVDVTESTPEIVDVLTVDNGGNLSDIIIVGNDIYISIRIGYFDGAIVKHPISTLSIDGDLAMNHSIKFHPNPTNDFIQVSGLIKGENYVVYDVLGTEVFNGVVSVGGKIDVRKLTDGMYFLKMNNHTVIKFMKK